MVEVMKEEERMEGVEVGCGEDGSGACAAGRARSSNMGGMRACGACWQDDRVMLERTIVSSCHDDRPQVRKDDRVMLRGRSSHAAETIVSC